MALTQELAPGNYEFKFIINREWLCSNTYNIVNDGRGNQNNCISVKGPPPPSTAPIEIVQIKSNGYGTAFDESHLDKIIEHTPTHFLKGFSKPKIRPVNVLHL
jgi:hypothetical protein